MAGPAPWWTPFKTEVVETLKQLIAAGQLKPFIARRYPLAQVVDAPLCRGRPRLRQGRHRLVATVGQIREEV
jgi:hypothetical protein